MKYKFFKAISFFLFCSLFVLISLNIPYFLISGINTNTFIAKNELDLIKKQGNNLFFNTNIKKLSASNGTEEKVSEYVIEYNLFNAFNIKNLKVKVVNDNLVYPGGNCVGLALKTKGVTLVGNNYIITKNGNVNTLLNSNLKVGDVITKLNDIYINDVSDVATVLENYVPNEDIIVEAKRNGETFTTKIKPALDIQTNKYKLGLWIKNDSLGVGTLTFVKDNNRYGCLGHAITNENGQNLEVSGGNIYECNVIGVKKGEKGNPGELMGLFAQGRNVQGDIDKNSDYGVFGNLYENNTFIENKKQMLVGGKLTAKPGFAQIMVCVDGYDIELFDIEIIKTNYQVTAENKSMIIKVTDDRLIEKTGGIVQGMSGSPIIQDNKIIGAITHIFVNDPLKGFGLYLDWMLFE